MRATWSCHKGSHQNICSFILKCQNFETTFKKFFKIIYMNAQVLCGSCQMAWPPDHEIFRMQSTHTQIRIQVGSAHNANNKFTWRSASRRQGRGDNTRSCLTFLLTIIYNSACMLYQPDVVIHGRDCQSPDCVLYVHCMCRQLSVFNLSIF